jgi:very-short-patch-repair endonuclease
MSWNQDVKYVSRAAVRNARQLRKAMTESEKRLWWHLRYRLPIEGSHFRRQMAIGPYVADFCCLTARLVVEVDGNQHGTDEAMAYDARRAAFLECEGFRVLRFSNADVMRDIESVLDTIYAALGGHHPHP